MSTDKEKELKDLINQRFDDLNVKFDELDKKVTDLNTETEIIKVDLAWIRWLLRFFGGFIIVLLIVVFMIIGSQA